MNTPLLADPFSVAGRRVLVVGGTRGIGRAIAAQLATGGADVIANYVRDEQAAQLLVDETAANGWALKVVRADASSEKGREQILQAVSATFSDLSVLVFAAATGVHKSCLDLTARHFDFTYALNLRAFLLLVQALVPKMSQGSSIIALSSEGAVHAMSNYGLVGSSKAALEALCRQFAVELAPRGIRVNVLSPGSVRTDAWAVLPDAERRLAQAIARTPRGRLTSPEEIAWVAQFLASEASAALAGHTLVADGGARACGEP